MENSNTEICKFIFDNSLELIIAEAEAYRRWGIGAFYFYEEHKHFYNMDIVDFKDKNMTEDIAKINP